MHFADSGQISFTRQPPPPGAKVVDRLASSLPSSLGFYDIALEGGGGGPVRNLFFGLCDSPTVLQLYSRQRM